MKKVLFFAFLLVLGFSSAGMADSSKLFGYFWPHDHWRDQDFKPYLENGTDPHGSKWQKNDDGSAWSPSQWLSTNGGNGLGLIQKWYNADIIRDQFVDDGAPTLVVGPNFYHLGDSDKRRLLATLDQVYAVTSQKPNMFFLQDWSTKKHIGYYTAKGLVLE